MSALAPIVAASFFLLL